MDRETLEVGQGKVHRYSGKEVSVDSDVISGTGVSIRVKLKGQDKPWLLIDPQALSELTGALVNICSDKSIKVAPINRPILSRL